MAQFNDDVRRMLGAMIADFDRGERARIAAAAKADPKKYALTRIMDGGTGYVYFPAGKVMRGRRCRSATSICVSKSRNAAGNFLIWRQVDQYRRGHWHQAERFEFKFSATKREARDLARRWSDRLLREAAERKPAKAETPIAA